MSLSPTSIEAPNLQKPAAYFFDDGDASGDAPAAEVSAELTPRDILAEMRSDLQGLEQRFAAFTQRLSHELIGLERTFARALRLFVRGGAGTGTAGGVAAAAPMPAVSPYDGIIRRAAVRNGVDPSLVGAVVRRESSFDPRAVSSAGAEGLMQLMPATARSLGVADPFDAAQNVEGGTRLLRSLLDRYGGRIDLALAAYNAGPAAVDAYGGVPPYPETQAYVSAVMADYRASALDAS